MLRVIDRGGEKMNTLDSAAILGIILMIVGFGLVGLELTMPGFSIPGISGIISLAFSVLLLAQTVRQGILLVLIILVILIIMGFIIFRFLSKGKFSKRLVLTEELDKEKGYTSSPNLTYLVGKRGIAQTDLRPTGIGDFEGILIDVLSEGTYIAKGAPLLIQRVEGAKVIVREIKSKS